MAFIDTIPTSASIDNDVQQAKAASNINGSEFAKTIRNEEVEERRNKINGLRNWMDKRSSLRKAISNGNSGTGNTGLDTSEVRKSRIADLARDALLNAGKDPDKIKNVKDDDLIKRLVGSNEGTDNKKMNAVNSYILNGGYAENVFNYLVGNTSSVYETLGEPEEEKSTTRNFLGAAISTPAESLAGMSDIVQKNIKYGGKTIYDINKESDIASLGNLIGQTSEERYQQYKSGDLASKRYEPYNKAEYPKNIGAIGSAVGLPSKLNELKFYKSYDEAKEKGFDGTVEQYGQYIYNMAQDAYQSTAEKVRDYLETEVYDPEGKGASAGKFVGEILEFALLPEAKVKYLKYLPEASKAEKAIKGTINLLKGTTKLGAQGVELQALEDAYNAEVSDIGEYATNATWNVALGGIINGMGNTLGKMGGVDKLSLGTKTKSQINEMINITKGARNKNAEVTPFTKVRDLLTNAKDKLLGDRLTKGEKLGEIRNFELKYKDGAKYTTKNAIEEDINKSLMQQASKKRFGGVAGKKSEIPQFTFTKKGIEVTNPDLLNNISRNEKGQVVKLWDDIKRVYSETYGAGASVNAATTEKFLRGLNKVFGKEGRSGGPENFISLMKEGIENATKKFDASLTEKSLSDLKAARLADEKAIKLDNTFNKIFGKLEGTEGVGAAEKATKDTVTTQELFKEVYKATDGKIDLNSDIGAWIAVMSAYNPRAAQRLLQTVYPSKPGAMELLIKTVLSMVTKGQVKRAAKDYTQGAMGKVWENIGGVVGAQL